MKILMPFRPDIYGDRVEEFSAVAMAVHLGNHLTQHGHELGYVTSMGPARFMLGSKIYPVTPMTPEITAIAESFLIYRDMEYDVLHIHTANFATFKQIHKYIGRGDRVVCTIHIPANIGRSFWYHREDLLALLQFPNFRLVCVSKSGSYNPLARAFGGTPVADEIAWEKEKPEGWDRVVMIHNGVIDVGQATVPWDQKIPRFMFVAHMMPSKNVTQTLLMAIENQIPCLYVGRRLPHKRLSPHEEEYATACETLIANNPGIITHVPYLQYPACIREMAQSRCLIILSELESFGFTPIEAAQVGTPTIWLGCQGIDETMDHGVTGYRINRAEAKFWKQRRARAAELYHRVHDLDQSQMAVRMRQRFSMGACTHQHEDLYRSVIQGAGAAASA